MIRLHDMSLIELDGIADELLKNEKIVARIKTNMSIKE